MAVAVRSAVSVRAVVVRAVVMVLVRAAVTVRVAARLAVVIVVVNAVVPCEHYKARKLARKLQ